MQNIKRSQDKVVARRPGFTNALAGKFYLPEKGLRSALIMLAAIVSLAFCVVATPAPAFAAKSLDSGEYTIESLNVSASILTDGSLQVTEVRVIHFERARVSMCWLQDLPEIDATQDFGGVSIAQMQSIDQEEVDLIPLEEIEYDPAWRKGAVPEGNVCSYDEENNRTYAFFDVEGEYVMMQNTYVINGAVKLYKDCAELRWCFVPAGQWSSATKNATCTIGFPVPADVLPIEGEDVYAWSHGPGGATLSFDSSVTSVTVAEDQVPADEYSEIRILLPNEWINNASPEVLAKQSTSMYKDSVLKNELEWVDMAAIRRMSQLFSFIVFGVLSLVLVAVSLVLYQAFGRVRKVEGNAVSALELMNRMPVAVIGRLWRWNRESERDFAAVVMNLIHKGAIDVNAVEMHLESEAPSSSYENNTEVLPALSAETTTESKVADNQESVSCAEQNADCCGQDDKACDLTRFYYLTETGRIARESMDNLDEYAMHLLFDVLGDSTGKIWVDDIAQCSNVTPKSFASKLDFWQAQLSEQVIKFGCFERKGLVTQKALVLVAGIYLCIALASSVSLQSFWPAFLALAGDVVIIAIANHMGRRSVAGSADYAACQKLRALLQEQLDDSCNQAVLCNQIGTHSAESEQDFISEKDSLTTNETVADLTSKNNHCVLKSLELEEWKQLLICAYVLDIRAAATVAARRVLPEETAALDRKTEKDLSYVSWLEAYEATPDRLALCDQLCLALSQVMDQASWSSQRARRKAERKPALESLKSRIESSCPLKRPTLKKEKSHEN